MVIAANIFAALLNAAIAANTGSVINAFCAGFSAAIALAVVLDEVAGR